MLTFCNIQYSIAITFIHVLSDMLRHGTLRLRPRYLASPLGAARHLASPLGRLLIHTRRPLATASTAGEERATASFYISNVFPVKLAYWDPRPAWAAIREQDLMDRLAEIGAEVSDHDFRIESWEIARKDGGVFMHFSYVPPKLDKQTVEEETEATATAPDIKVNPTSPGWLFLPALNAAAEKHGGFPSWLGQWWAARSFGNLPGHQKYPGREVIETEDGKGPQGVRWMAGGGRVWVVKGKQWTEDMNRFPSNRLRVEFDGADVSQEMLYTLFRVRSQGKAGSRMTLTIAVRSSG